jgi:hypothetical protein
MTELVELHKKFKNLEQKENKKKEKFSIFD